MFPSLMRDRRGVGTVVGTVFFLLVLMTAFMYYGLRASLADRYNETLQEMQELDLKRSKESLEILRIAFSNGELNITVRNKGSNIVHIIWLGIFDETATPEKQDYYRADFYVNPGETVTNVGNDTIPSFDGEKRVLQLVTDLGNTFIKNYPETEVEYDYVDAEGDPPAIGTHSFFEAQRSGPDGVVDTLQEVINDQEEWVSPTGYEDPGNEWSAETNAYDDNTGTYAVDDIPAGSWSNYLILTRNATTCAKIQYFIGRQSVQIAQVEIDIYNGTWTNVYSGAGTWNTWANVSFVETTVTMMRFRFFNSHRVQPRQAYVYEADFLRSPTLNYQLDLEVQWIAADYDETYEWLCIYAGRMGSEDLRVDVWNGASWVTAIARLETGWNSVDVSTYLTSSTFKIRFRGTTETGDIAQDSWEIDATFLHVWTKK